MVGQVRRRPAYLTAPVRAFSANAAILACNCSRGRDQQCGARRWKTIWSAGQGVGASQAVEPVAAIVAQLEREYREALADAAARQ